MGVPVRPVTEEEPRMGDGLDSSTFEGVRWSPFRGDHPGFAQAVTIRAVTMPNMPEGDSAWLRMWQCQAHTPGSVAV